MQKALLLARDEGSENSEEVANSRSHRLSIARKKYMTGKHALNEVIRDMDSKFPENTREIKSQPQGLRKIYHLPNPGLAREAMEAGLLACQSPVEVDNDSKQPASNLLIGMNYYSRGERQYDLQNAISYLEAAQNEESSGTKTHLLSCIWLADARWKLGRAREDIPLLLAAMESMALLLEKSTADASAPSKTLFDMMDRCYYIWKASHRAEFLCNAAKFVPHLLREDETGDISPNNLSALLCKVGEIAADIRIVQPDQTLLQEPLTYWRQCWQNRRASLNTRLHAMHLASQHLSRQKRYTDAFQHAKKAVELIRFACSAHLDVSEREEMVPLLNGISVDACALGIKLGRDEEALELLEQGRGILNFLPDAFADSLNELRCKLPQLFMKFDRCHQNILASSSSRHPAGPEIVETESPSGNNADDDVDQLTSVLAEIRQKPTFKNFYRPITAAEMQSLATSGPVVVLVGSSLLPYAVIVRQQSIQTVDLSPEAVAPSPL